MKKVIFALLALFILGALVVYALQGGFSKVEVTRQTSQIRYVAGQYYEGPVRSKEFSELFEKAGRVVADKQLAGNPGGIYYNNPAEAKGQIKAFVGVVIKDPNAKLPAGYEVRTLQPGKPVLQATVNAHQSMIPGKAYPALFDYAEKNNLTLQQLYVEEYPSEKQGTIEVYLKQD